ncbi:hypothetical protein [Butyrivibrio sp. YAB3001]|uniref:hypothetical protein n=1 Tax=Butyrivibrio sp. YAB3001 TaxID=1520812 RepID=UPI0008F61EA5|nr:hypothetical protein [Butyrivibrio sp. YAB3001]SFC60025.1 hypothetical protein SAMN02910398_02646 [Butyrivibrio sp. YAB3001]
MRKDEIIKEDNSRIEQQNEEKVNQIVDDLTLFDDDLMSLVFDKNIPATQLVLRIIFNRDIEVISVEGQEELKNPLVGGRDITLDIHAKSSKNMHYKELAEGVHHFKETEEGRDIVCESVKRYAEQYAEAEAETSRINTLVQSVKMLMKNTSVTLDQAFSNLGISDNDRKIISKQLKK